MPALLRLLSCLLVAVAAVLVAPAVMGRAADSERRVVLSVFFVAKSENRNQVHYGIRLDEGCAPAGDAPVFAYWRMLEQGPLATEPLLSHELAAYGIATQRPQAFGDHGGQVRVTLNALPGRPIVVDAQAQGTTCTATARATIDGAPAALTSVFVQLRWPFGVAYLMLSGRATLDGRVVHERVAN